MSTVTLNDYSNGQAYCLRSPVARNRSLLGTDPGVHYTPTESNITLWLTVKGGNNAQLMQPSEIYNLTVLALADIVSSTITTKGNEDFPRSGQINSTFATSTSNLQFMMTTSDRLPVYAVTDVLRALQELTHSIFFFWEVVFDVFSDASPTSSPIASGCMAFHCGAQFETVQTRDLVYANVSAVNLTSAPSRRLQSTSSLQLTTVDEPKALIVEYEDLKDALPIHDESFADVATRMLANITHLIIANHGDGPLPRPGPNKHPVLRVVDVRGSNLTISLLPVSVAGFNFTLGQAAMALKITQESLSARSMVESKLAIMLDGSMVGWGCLIYASTSKFRCLMPSPETTSSAGRCKESLFV